MRLLLDTHTFVWWDEAALPPTVARRIERAGSVFVSAVCAWEIAIKAALGKIDATGSVEEALADYGFIELPVRVRHADAVRALPSHHRDPFDRLLVAQALIEELVIVSNDRVLRRYPAQVVWD